MNGSRRSLPDADWSLLVARGSSNEQRVTSNEPRATSNEFGQDPQVVAASAALVPVILFLTTLFLMDSFKLVPPRSVMLSLLAGAGSAVVVLWLHQLLLPDALSAEFVSRDPGLDHRGDGLGSSSSPRSSCPARVGFLVDAGVQGFAVGAGFALVENVLYLQALLDAPSRRALAGRELGTAMLHGATTAIVAMAGRARYDRRNRQVLAAFLPGFALAVGLHSASNHLLLHPVAQTLIILMILPAVVTWIFDRSERATREWVSAGLTDLDLEVLQLVVSEHFSVTRFGEYLRELRERFRRAGRRRHVLPAASRARARRAGQGARHGARGGFAPASRR